MSFGSKPSISSIALLRQLRVTPAPLSWVPLVLAIGGCGASSASPAAEASAGAGAAGAAQRETSAGGAQAGSTNAGAFGASGAAGTHNEGTSGAYQGTGGIYEVCLICAGSGAAVEAGNGGTGGAAGGVATGGAGGTSALLCSGVTCAPNQYCRAPCTGFGGAMGKPSCAELPTTCSGVPSCACICGATNSFCIPGAHEIQCGCG